MRCTDVTVVLNACLAINNARTLQPEASAQGCSLTKTEPQSFIIKEKEGARKRMIWRPVIGPHAEN